MYEQTWNIWYHFKGISISLCTQKSLVKFNISIFHQLKKTVIRVQIKNNEQIENPVYSHYRLKNRSFFLVVNRKAKCNAITNSGVPGCLTEWFVFTWTSLERTDLKRFRNTVHNFKLQSCYFHFLVSLFSLNVKLCKLLLKLKVFWRH